MPYNRYRRDRSEISCCLKYVIFSFNVIFWILGFLIMGVGVWAWTEKDTFSNLSRMTHVPMDPAFLLIVAGAITFVIGFTGCVGALRENTCLLAFYSISLAILLLLEMTAGVLCFMFKDWFKTQASEGFGTFIVHYRDDLDQQNMIDWIQGKWLHCCGIEGPNDWDNNQYFNCSATAVSSAEACGVPFSCCRPRQQEIIRNKQCGYNVRSEKYAGEQWTQNNLTPVAGVMLSLAVFKSGDLLTAIYDIGCLPAGEEWIKRNLLVVAGVVIAISFLQILGICFAQNMRADIFAQKSKWR